jgi:hypothetical protein
VSLTQLVGYYIIYAWSGVRIPVISLIHLKSGISEIGTKQNKRNRVWDCERN